ncbi:MAG TPA: enoyl-CoA hydratase [Thermoanaerobaculia bacterium]|jgi:2-(1,2-epoxy-1,2-dihydrophenyl)acetyl-CoA isomerase|nr:enoyl-CoA hydratase [Thermoanaerobaculia bacterium]
MFIDRAIADSVATITLNRPDKLNAFTGTMREDLLVALRACEEDGDVRVIVITGAGRAFCAGGDVEFMSGLQKSGDVGSFRKLLDAGRDVILQIATMPKPVIAAVNGIAAGAGCNLALACDYRIASEQAKLSESFVRIGLHPDWGGTWLLPRLVGRSRALEILISGRTVDAAEALAIGMVDRVVADLGAETEKLARTLAAAPPLALAGIKRAVLAAESNDLRAQLDLEAEHQLTCFQSKDGAEGLAAFFEKRAAVFQGD